jgi:osmotically-inducible protein OsmY
MVARNNPDRELDLTIQLTKEESQMTDKQLQQNVLHELDWEPGVRSTDIGVSVHEGVVTLSGFVDTYAEKFGAEDAAKRIFGVKGLANDLTVTSPNTAQRPDSDLAEAAVRALAATASVPAGHIQTTVRDGAVILEGEVDWQYQSTAAGNAVRWLPGVRDVRNRITVKPHVSSFDVKTKIEDALRRSAEVEARRITVDAADGKVTLRGNVHSWHERSEAVQAAWRAPGVTRVEDLLMIQP